MSTIELELAGPAALFFFFFLWFLRHYFSGFLFGFSATSSSMDFSTPFVTLKFTFSGGEFKGERPEVVERDIEFGNMVYGKRERH
jgi:hypothetical protein